MKITAINSERLVLKPLERDRLLDFIKRNRTNIVPELQEALETQIIPAFPSAGENWIYYTLWAIKIKNGGPEIGSFCFKGPPENCMVEIGYGIDAPYRNKGYCAETVASVISWCTEQPEIKKLTAQTLQDNAASKRVLEKCGFSPTGRILEENGKPLMEFEILV